MRTISNMRPTFVRLDGEHHEILAALAESEGTTISALLRRAAIQVFSLPTGSGKVAETSDESALPHTEERPTVANVTEAAS